MTGVATLALDAIALALCVGVLAGAIGAATARSLFSASMFVGASGALAAAALAAMGTGEASLAQALFGVGIAPVLLLASLLLSTRAAKPRRQGRPWLTIAMACAAAGALVWAIPDLGPPVLALPRARAGVFELSATAWLAVLVFVAAASAMALLGYGERGALQRLKLERDE